jgi:hypothetical protein
MLAQCSMLQCYRTTPCEHLEEPVAAAAAASRRTQRCSDVTYIHDRTQVAQLVFRVVHRQARLHASALNHPNKFSRQYVNCCAAISATAAAATRNKPTGSQSCQCTLCSLQHPGTQVNGYSTLHRCVLAHTHEHCPVINLCKRKQHTLRKGHTHPQKVLLTTRNPSRHTIYGHMHAALQDMQCSLGLTVNPRLYMTHT